jgi:hypothetical protein
VVNERADEAAGVARLAAYDRLVGAPVGPPYDRGPGGARRLPEREDLAADEMGAQAVDAAVDPVLNCVAAACPGRCSELPAGARDALDAGVRQLVDHRALPRAPGSVERANAELHGPGALPVEPDQGEARCGERRKRACRREQAAAGSERLVPGDQGRPGRCGSDSRRSPREPGEGDSQRRRPAQ